MVNKKRIIYRWLGFVFLVGLLAGCVKSTTPTPIPQPDSLPLLVWQREGGIAGFCDGVRVYANGRVQLTTCQNEVVAERTLPPEMQKVLDAYVQQLAAFEEVWADPAVADAMTVRVKFAGQGNEATSDMQKETVRDFAAEISAKLKVDTIAWDDAVNLLMDGQVKQVAQTHALEVTLILRDGTEMKTVEPVIDAVFQVINECGDACQDMILMTE
jgi:hypothetical protein